MERFTFDQEMDGGRFVLYDDQTIIGEVTYRKLSSNEISINHTYVKSQFEGRGYGNKLVCKVMDFAKENNLQLSATCWFAVKVINAKSDEQ